MFDFETVHDRLAWSAIKWEKYRDRDVIPLWIADMDFPAAPAIRAALAAHVEAGEFGYGSVPRDLPDRLVAEYRTRYGWTIAADWIVWLPGLVLGLNLAVKTCCTDDQSAIALSPVYPPFLGAPALQGRRLLDIPLTAITDSRPDGIRLDHAIDFAALENAVKADPAARLLLLCHPHNPIGRLFTADELDRLAAFCERHDLFVCSDEVHCDLILDGTTPHRPMARIMAERSPTLLARTITLHGPGKTYNIAGLGIAWAIIPDAALRRRFRAAMQRLVPEVCCVGFTALRAALIAGEPWRQALLARLRQNRDRATAALSALGLPHTVPEVGFLIWIDARSLGERVGDPAAFFERHGVGLSNGVDFGRPGHLRLNFATPPSLLEQALQRMHQALAAAAAAG